MIKILECIDIHDFDKFWEWFQSMLMLKAEYPAYWAEIVLSKIISDIAIQDMVTFYADTKSNNSMLYVINNKSRDEDGKEIKVEVLCQMYCPTLADVSKLSGDNLMYVVSQVYLPKSIASFMIRVRKIMTGFLPFDVADGRLVLIDVAHQSLMRQRLCGYIDRISNVVIAVLINMNINGKCMPNIDFNNHSKQYSAMSFVTMVLQPMYEIGDSILSRCIKEMMSGKGGVNNFESGTVAGLRSFNKYVRNCITESDSILFEELVATTFNSYQIKRRNDHKARNTNGFGNQQVNGSNSMNNVQFIHDANRSDIGYSSFYDGDESPDELQELEDEFKYESSGNREADILEQEQYEEMQDAMQNGKNGKAGLLRVHEKHRLQWLDRDRAQGNVQSDKVDRNPHNNGGGPKQNPFIGRNNNASNNNSGSIPKTLVNGNVHSNKVFKKPKCYKFLFNSICNYDCKDKDHFTEEEKIIIEEGQLKKLLDKKNQRQTSDQHSSGGIKSSSCNLVSEIAAMQVLSISGNEELSCIQQRELNNILKKCMMLVCNDMVEGSADTGNHCSTPLIKEEAAMLLVNGDRSRIVKAAPIHMILANDETTAVTDRAINLKLKIKSNETGEEAEIESLFYIHNSGVDILFNLQTLVMKCGSMFTNVLTEAKKQGEEFIRKCKESNFNMNIDEVKFSEHALSFYIKDEDDVYPKSVGKATIFMIEEKEDERSMDAGNCNSSSAVSIKEQNEEMENAIKRAENMKSELSDEENANNIEEIMHAKWCLDIEEVGFNTWSSDWRNIKRGTGKMVNLLYDLRDENVYDDTQNMENHLIQDF